MPAMLMPLLPSIEPTAPTTPGYVVVMQDENIALRNGFEIKIIDPDDARVFLAEDGAFNF